jgi:hypothetical protein
VKILNVIPEVIQITVWKETNHTPARTATANTTTVPTAAGSGLETDAAIGLHAAALQAFLLVLVLHVELAIDVVIVDQFSKRTCFWWWFSFLFRLFLVVFQ